MTEEPSTENFAQASSLAVEAPPRRTSLSTRLTLIVVPLVLLAGFLAADIIGLIKVRETRLAQIEQGHVLAQSYAALLRTYLVEMDTPQIAPVLQAAASNAPVVCASLAPRGLPLHYGWPVIDCARDGGKGPLVQAPVRQNGQDVAVLTLRLRNDYVGTALWASAAPSVGAIAATLLALGLVLAVTLRAQVADPILRITEAMRRLSQGRTDFAIPCADRRDEIGQMAEALAVFRDTKIAADQTAAELRDAQAELIESAKLAFLGSMVAGVAHEVNTPIGICVTAMSTAEDLIADIEKRLKSRQLSEQGLVGFLEKMRGSGALVLSNLDRAATLIRSFKGIATDQASETPRRLDLAQYLPEIVASLHPELKRTRIAVAIRCDGPVALTALAGPLWQIVSNLVLNGTIHAFDAGAPGTITLSAETLPDGRVRIGYEDDGKGMTPEIRARIFEPFFTTRRGQGGTGLGLFITYNLVTQTLGGRIQCDSEPGDGTRFDILLPATPPRPASAEAAEMPEVSAT